MNLLVGRFYYKLTDSKNLIGEFSNNQCEDRNYTESAIVIKPKPNEPPVIAEPFVGTYRSTWCEHQGSVSCLAELKISKQSIDVFLLEWRFVKKGNVESHAHFVGQGMLCDGMLIGNYWDEQGSKYIKI